jgi:3'(2'), 5'-bisphosphate nucleotidase
VVAEEAASRGEVPQAADVFFLVDPLDGTREYISGEDDFTVNIALIDAGAPIFGLVYAPARGWLLATTGPGAAIEAKVAADSGASRLEELATTRVGTRAPDPAHLVAVASRRHGQAETDAFLARLGIKNERRIGSSLKFGLLARGDADIYPRFGEINEWDTAAGHAVLVAAGGCVTVADGSDLTYGKADQRYLNPHFVAWGRRELVCPF